jgi:hypothetical protein
VATPDGCGVVSLAWSRIPLCHWTCSHLHFYVLSGGSGFLHHVPLTGLLPGTTYVYMCGDFTAGLTSGSLYFTTMAAVGGWT